MPKAHRRWVPLLLLLAAPARAEKPQAPQPFRIETARVTLLLVDVYPVDDQGRPIEGLTREDFTVFLNGKQWPISSVDDLCGKATVPGAQPPAPDTSPGGRIAPPSETPAASPDPLRIALYIDFSQLQVGGRAHALEEAKRWVKDDMHPGDLVTLAAYSTSSGFRTLAAFTSDKARLLRAIDAASGDLSLVDPFPTFRDQRMNECALNKYTCAPHAWSEYEQGSRSRQALENFTQSLGFLPGRKMVLYFNQNANTYPGRFYIVDGRPAISQDHDMKFKSLGTVATDARAVIYPAFVGNYTDGITAEEAERTGFELARYTGGRHNKGLAQLAELTREARLRAGCLYRIALEPPKDSERGLRYTVRVFMRGHVIEDELRMRTLSPHDLWLKTARSALANPAFATALPVSAGITPIAAVKKEWTLEVQVAVDLDAVLPLPLGERVRRAWEVGGFLLRDEGKGKWDLFGTFETSTPKDEPSNLTAVHRKTFSSMPPGEYHFAAYVRDTTLNVFGAADAWMRLPDPREEGGVAGPVLTTPHARQISLTLPLMSESTGTSSVHPQITEGVIPVKLTSVDPVEPIVLSTWICNGGAALSQGDPPRFLTIEGVPFRKFPAPEISPAGDCTRVDDVIREKREVGHFGYQFAQFPRAKVEFDVANPLNPRSP